MKEIKNGDRILDIQFEATDTLTEVASVMKEYTVYDLINMLGQLRRGEIVYGYNNPENKQAEQVQNMPDFSNSTNMNYNFDTEIPNE